MCDIPPSACTAVLLLLQFQNVFLRMRENPSIVLERFQFPALYRVNEATHVCVVYGRRAYSPALQSTFCP